MVLGERTSKDIIRHGQTKAVVEAMFQIEDESIADEIKSIGVKLDDNMLILHREITQDGRSICRANGQLITTTMLKEIAKNLVNIHGQHDSQRLLIPSNHIEFLDRYANIDKEKEEYLKVFEENRKIKEQLQKLHIDESEKQRRIDILSFQIDEIEKAKLQANEEEELKEKQTYLSNIEKINNAVQLSYELIYNSESSVYDKIAIIKRELEGVNSFDEKLEEFYKIIDEISLNIEDLAYQLRDYADEREYEGDQLDKIEQRLDLIHNLKRKYGNNIDEILAFKEKADMELSQIKNSEQDQKQLLERLETNEIKLKEFANNLTKQRKRSAKLLEDKIMAELCDLEMAKTKFSVQITPCDYNKLGADKVEFLIATNAGEPLKPLSKIASGGELSRIMLAIQSILADTDMVGTLIFDEIDNGISGRTAQKTAEKIAAISNKKQVICVTHLAQIASAADTHFAIEKETVNETARTNVIPLDREGRKKELARIIGGAKITDLTIKSAEEMLKFAEEMRKAAGG